MAIFKRRLFMRSLLFLAPIPALLMSIVLMRFADVSKILWIQQVVLGALALVCAYAFSNRRSSAWSTKSQVYLLVFLSLLLFLPPLLGSSTSPQRWLVLGGFRLYIAACVLPLILILLESLIHENRSDTSSWIFFYPVISLALAWQPDASQSLALAAIGVISIARSGARTLMKASCIVPLLVATMWSSAQPDPLQPVAYVEGVIQLAATIHIGFAGVSLLFVVLPPLILILMGRRYQQSGFFMLALYYLVIDVCAYLQLTPMPLLGFGAGPILGYAFMAYAANRKLH